MKTFWDSNLMYRGWWIGLCSSAGSQEHVAYRFGVRMCNSKLWGLKEMIDRRMDGQPVVLIARGQYANCIGT